MSCEGWRPEMWLAALFAAASCAPPAPAEQAAARASQSGSRADGSLLANGSMEVGESRSEDDSIGGWQIPPEVAGNGRRTWSGDHAHGGRYGKGLRSGGSAPFFDIQLVHEPALPGSEVVLSGWVRSNRAGSRVTARLRWTADGFEDLVDGVLPDEDWHFFSKRISLPARVDQIAVACIVGGMSDGSFDDIRLERVAEREGTAPAPAAVGTGTSTDFMIGMPLGGYRGQRDISETLDLMRDSGMNLLHVHSTWQQLERVPGDISIAGSGGLDNARKLLPGYPELEGLVVVIAVIETNVRALPARMSAMAFDDAALLSGLDAVIDTVADSPLADEANAVLIGNEVDAYLSKHPQELTAFAKLLERAALRIRARMPHVATGTIFTAQGVRRYPEVFDALHPLGDLIVYTYYPIAPGLNMKPNDEVARDLQFLGRRAGDTPFAFTEIGCSSNPVNGSSEEHQAEFVRQVFTSLDPFQRSGQLRFLHYMTTFDPPVTFTRDYAEEQAVASPEFMAFMTSLGLRDQRSGAPKLAWEPFIEGARAWRTGRPLPDEWPGIPREP